jgi:hypothetical protein
VCGKQFIGGARINNNNLWNSYVHGKQTYKQLSISYGISISTIKRRLDKVSESKEKGIVLSHSVVHMDTTYFGLGFGVLVMKDTYTKNILWLKFVHHETLSDYAEGIRIIENQGTRIDGIVCDGLRGMFYQFSQYRVQMCQFHQVQIVLRYITRKPKLQASIELKSLMHLMCKTDKESFIGAFEDWCVKWESFLNERLKDPQTGKSRYVHKRLRSAYLSVKRNLPWLFTWYDNIEIGIPNTNNLLEGCFTALKNKLRNHNGLSRERKRKFIKEFFKA